MLACPIARMPPLDPVRAARLSPSAFARYVTKGRFDLPPHLALLERKLVEVAAGRIKRLGVSVPPRHGKSWMSSRFFPAWFLGTFPDKRVILASYESDFAAQWGRSVRDILTEHGPTVFGISVRQDSSAANRWDVEGRLGGMQTAGAGGPLMGKGADLLLIDDPHKNWDEVFLPTIREKIWEWYQSTASSRLEPGAGVVILQQRWHEDDLLGHVLNLDAQQLERWDRVDFPALAESNDVLGRKPGEALWPARFSAEALNAHRVTIHPKFWEAQYQQHPTPLGGSLFRRERAKFYRIEGSEYVFRDDGSYTTAEIMDRFVTVDTATSSKTSADFTAIACWGYDALGRLLLLDLDMRRIEGPEIMRSIIALCQKWRTIAWVEENSTSKHLLSFMESQGVPFRTLHPGAQNKFTRALPASAMWEQGRVFLPESADWLAGFEQQLYRFTGTGEGNDDAVDCFAYACRVVLEELSSGAGLQPISSIGGRGRGAGPMPSGFSVPRPAGF